MGLLGLFVLGLLGHTQGVCLKTEDVQRLQHRFAFPQELQTSNFCNTSSNDFKLLSALLFINKTNLPKTNSPLDKNILPQNIWIYFTKHTAGFTNEKSCGKDVVAFVLEEDPGIIHLCPAFYAQDSLAERVATLLHEARHHDIERHPHERCTQGRLSGAKNSCDASVQNAGGYAVEMESLVRMAALPDHVLSVRDKSSARNMALMLAIENFNTPVVAEELRAMYAVDEQGQAFIIDPHTWDALSVRSITPQIQNLASRSTTLNVFPQSGEAVRIDVLSKNMPALPAQGSFSEEYNSLEAHLRPQILNIFNTPTHAGVVITHNSVLSYAGTAFESEAPFEFSAVQVFDSFEAGTKKSDALFVMDSQNRLYHLNFIYGRFESLTAVPNFLGPVKNIVFVNNQRVALAASGEIQVFENDQWTSLRPLAGRRFQFISKPFYWARFLFE